MFENQSKMISLKSYLFRDSDGNADMAYRRIIELLLQGIALHAVEGEKADYLRFRSNMDEAAAKLTPETPMAELHIIVGGVLRALEDYNRRTSKFVSHQNAELQNMVSMLTKTVITIGASSDNSVGKLQQIEKSIEQARVVEDIQLLKLRLGECLEAVREEALRQKSEGQTALKALQDQLAASGGIGSITHARNADSATGLSGKAEAERAIRVAAGSPHNKFLLIAVANRVQAVNARFGYAVGDRVLAASAEHFQKSLSVHDQIYRWQGPAFLCILERVESIDQVRDEIRRFADAKLDKTVDIGNRTVLIPISASWSVFPIVPSVEALLKKIDTFTAAQMPRDYV